MKCTGQTHFLTFNKFCIVSINATIDVKHCFFLPTRPVSKNSIIINSLSIKVVNYFCLGLLFFLLSSMKTLSCVQYSLNWFLGILYILCFLLHGHNSCNRLGAGTVPFKVFTHCVLQTVKLFYACKNPKQFFFV